MAVVDEIFSQVRGGGRRWEEGLISTVIVHVHGDRLGSSPT